MAKLKTVERLTEDLQDIIKKLYTRMDGTDKEKRETIENEIKKIIEEAINSKVEAVQKIRKRVKVTTKDKVDARKKVSDEEFIKAARKDPNVERLAQKFGYKSIISLRAKMRKIGISTDYKIATMIRENPDKDDETIAAEVNVEVEAVQKIREEKVNKRENSNSDKAIKAETQQGGVIQGSVHLKSQQTIGSMELQQTTDIRERLERDKKAEEKRRREEREEKFICLARKLTDPRIIAKEMNMHLETVYNKLKYYGIWDRKRVVENLNKSNEEIAVSGKIELSAVEQVRRQEASKNTIQAKEIQLQKQIQRKRAEQSNPKQMQLEKMAKRFEPIDKIEGATGIPEYEIILWLRKHKVASRTEVERLMENTKMTDEQIASKSGGNVEDIKKIREIVKKREKLIARIPETIRTSIISALNSNNGFVSEPYIIKKFNITSEQFRALKQKWIRDRGSAVSESKRRVDLKNEINSIRTIASNNGSSVKIKIARVLALYDDLLTPAEYALFAYKYYQTGNYLEAVELGKEYLGLNIPTVAGMLRRIREVTDQAKEQKGYQITIGED